MVIGDNKLDDVELMRGKHIPATRLVVGDKVSLFDLSKENQERVLQWEHKDTVIIDPSEFNSRYLQKRSRDLALLNLSEYLQTFDN